MTWTVQKIQKKILLRRASAKLGGRTITLTSLSVIILRLITAGVQTATMTPQENGVLLKSRIARILSTSGIGIVTQMKIVGVGTIFCAWRACRVHMGSVT